MAVGLAVLLAFQWALSELPPTSRRSEPMAIPYLARQVYDVNRYRRPGHIYWSVDPYVRAATALREEGRAISANLVEAERLRRRTEMLSWRHHFLAKLGLVGVEKLANYGFDVAKTVVVMAFVVLFASMTARAAHTCGALVYQSEPGHEQADLQKKPAADPKGASPDRNAGASAPTTSAPDEPQFISLWYGASVVVPFLTLDDYKAWKVVKPKPPNSCGHWPRALTTSWKPFFSISGLLLTTIIAVAVSTRVKSAFNDVRE
ncbi:MAG: hypothetical protein JSR98_19800 [Proteobacteria bacterium]|nr:hypothetical protein [Pseudomonadota bacterium]